MPYIPEIKDFKVLQGKLLEHENQCFQACLIWKRLPKIKILTIKTILIPAESTSYNS